MDGLNLFFSLLQKQYGGGGGWGGGGAIHAIKLGLAETIESNADMKLELVYSVHSTILMQQTKQNPIVKVAKKFKKSVFLWDSALVHVPWITEEVKSCRGAD